MPKPKTCSGAGVPVAFSWIATPEGTFKRFMVRYCRTCAESHFTELRYVDPDYVVCPACLGQRVHVERSGGYLRIDCQECHQRSAFDDEDEGFELPGDDDDDEDTDTFL